MLIDPPNGRPDPELFQVTGVQLSLAPYNTYPPHDPNRGYYLTFKSGTASRSIQMERQTLSVLWDLLNSARNLPVDLRVRWLNNHEDPARRPTTRILPDLRVLRPNDREHVVGERTVSYTPQDVYMEVTSGPKAEPWLAMQLRPAVLSALTNLIFIYKLEATEINIARAEEDLMPTFEVDYFW